MDFVNIPHDIVTTFPREIINDPLTYARHWPCSETESGLVDFSLKERNAYMSLYHGDFATVGSKLAPLTDNFKDFTILTNPPYGH